MTADPWSAAVVARVDDAIGRRWTGAGAFADALAWPFGGGGKRIRPLLCAASAEACGADPLGDGVIAACVALEIVHTYSLVHDDLPCMDDDDLRRGRPTVHRRFDEATAVLVGDALLTEAFAVLAEAPLPPTSIVQLVGLLAGAAGHRGMVGGQVADVGPVPVDFAALLDVHARKTGALIRAAAACGAVAGGGDQGAQASFGAYGAAVGVAFQLADDLLDASVDDGRPSAVRFVGADAVAGLAVRHAEAAVAALGAKATPRLVALAYAAARRAA